MFKKEKPAENKEISQFRRFLAPGIEFLGKNTLEIVYLKKIRENFFWPFFGEIAYFSLFSPNGHVHDKLGTLFPL